MRLHAVGGLCNRLRAILSYLAAHDTLTVVWEPDEYVSHGRFSDVFGPLDGVTFVGNTFEDTCIAAINLEAGLHKNLKFIDNRLVSPAGIMAYFIRVIDTGTADNGTCVIKNNTAGFLSQLVADGSLVTSAPASGNWYLGNKVYNSNPSSGSYEGWICTTAGTPGTWFGFGKIG